MARSEPINATHAHSKANVSLFFADSLFVAGEHVSGKMELECKAERGLGIGDIKVELFAIQELTSRDHSATNTFLHLTRYFQGTGLPPSNAVHPHPLPGDDNVLPVDYHLARKGTTTFFFKFPLPTSSPASIDFGKGLAKLKYEVRATVSVSWRSERQRVMERREVVVVEAPADYPEDTERIVVGENGKIWAQGRVLNPYVVAGRDACVELFVKNHSTKRTTGLSLTLARYLHLPSTSHLQQTLQLSDVLANVPFRGPEYIVQPGTEGVANLVFSVPRDAQGVRSGRLETGEEDEGREPVESLFDVQCMLEIKMGMGLGNKDILLELPIAIFHPAAMRALPPLLPPPEPPIQRLRSPPAQAMSLYQSPSFSPTYDAYPGAYISPPMSPPVLPPNLSVWSPPPAQVIPPQQPMMLDQWYYYPPPPPVQYAYPARPSSADPFVSRPLPTLPTQNVSVPAGTGPPAQNGVGVADVGVDMNARPVEGEPGKGERASRISAHLRMSSRNRSASPPSHRFPEAAALPPPSMVDNNGATPAQLQVAPSPLLVDFPRTSPTQSHEVLSPRPVLTPKQSFSHDRGTVKSEHVIDLERMAAEQEAEKNSSPNTGRRSEDRNKTLPPAPNAPETPDTPRLPPEPTLLPLPTRPHPEIWRRESGLAALERKLLEQVGTRKPEADRPPDVRSVLPEPIKIPSSNDPRSDPPNDSAISSLALGADNSFQDAPPPPKLDAVPSTSPLARQDGVDEDTSLERRMVNGRKKGKRNHVRNLREAATGRVAAWLGRIDCAASPPETQTSPFSSPEVSLQDLPSPTDLGPHPLLRSPAVVLPEREETNESPQHDTIPTRSSGFVLHAAKDTSSTFAPPPTKRSEIRVSPQNGAAATSSPETPTVTSPSPLKPVLRRLMEAPGKGQPMDAKYDVRSARGGRGGKVTSVAALWASLASQQQQTPPVRQPEKAAGTFTPTFKGAQTRTTPEKDKERDKRRPPRTPPHAKKRHEDTNGTNVADLSARRARMVKATSVPAVVSSSLATPVLSSTASLARPIQAAPYPTKQRTYPPVHTSLSPFAELSPQAESSPPRAHASSSSSSPSSPLMATPKSPVVANELAFGQARLKDLIRKYQQGFGQ